MFDISLIHTVTMTTGLSHTFCFGLVISWNIIFFKSQLIWERLLFKGIKIINENRLEKTVPHHGNSSLNSKYRANVIHCAMNWDLFYLTLIYSQWKAGEILSWFSLWSNWVWYFHCNPTDGSGDLGCYHWQLLLMVFHPTEEEKTCRSSLRTWRTGCSTSASGHDGPLSRHWKVFFLA